ncbi:MAG: cupredoxin domain-containing protein [Patescibacteria group bacterium]
MNKYITLLIALFVLVGGGLVYQQFFVKEENKPVTTGAVREFSVVAKKDEWKFEPDFIEVNRGDKIILHVRNEDKYDHGIAIDAFGISQRIPANQDITIEFVATQQGEFPFYCSVPCGDGMVDGIKRGHLDQVGKIKVMPLTP